MFQHVFSVGRVTVGAVKDEEVFAVEGDVEVKPEQEASADATVEDGGAEAVKEDEEEDPVSFVLD